jgi:CIC family chloride channel protein
MTFEERLFAAFNRIRLPGPSVLPAAGAVVGLYAGLAAGLFANLIALVSGVAFAPAQLFTAFTPGSGTIRSVWDAFAAANWNLELALVGGPLAGAALLLARLIEPGDGRDEARRRLRILALLVLGALGLYYPLVALTALNTVFGHSHDLVEALAHLPWWLMLAAPALGGVAVGAILRNHPETHGHGVPEVVMAVKRARDGLPAEGGVLKLFASAVTIGSGGSAGREGPIVYGGAAFASAVGRTLGFSRKELAILLAAGAGAGISASFNAPIAGAVFAMEIILREFEMKVFSPIILASVTATIVGRGVLGGAPMLRRIGYEMVSGWEILLYGMLGLLVGLIAYGFIRMLHHSEGFFAGRFPGRLSSWLGSLPLPARAGLGGFVVGLMVMVNPVVWGSGHDYVNLASVRQLSFGFLLAACVLKLLATAITIGSGGSGGTFFPAAVIGAMAGGAFGEVAHAMFPGGTAPSGAYAMVGMGGAVAALTRGPLTGMMMLYELSGNYAIILPLMVTCTIASALCHTLAERRAPKVMSDDELLTHTQVRKLMLSVPPVPAQERLRRLVDLLLEAEEGALPVLDARGRAYGVVQVEHLREVWREPGLQELLVALDVARKVPVVSADSDVRTAMAFMDQQDVDALPVVDASRPQQPYGLLTRASVRRLLFDAHARAHAAGDHPVAAAEL